MKIELTEGCTAFGCDIDGVSYLDIEKDKLCEIVHKLVDKCSKDELCDLVWGITEVLGELEKLGRCEQCGDTVIKYTVELE